MKKLKGFTLIELLIVIAIIGILASIVIVSMSGVRSKANTAGFKSTVSSLQPALLTCCDASTIVAYNANGITDICTAALQAYWPTPAQMKLSAAPGVAITSNCSNGAFTVNVTPAAGSGLNSSCEGAATTINATSVTFPAGC